MCILLLSRCSIDSVINTFILYSLSSVVSWCGGSVLKRVLKSSVVIANLSVSSFSSVSFTVLCFEILCAHTHLELLCSLSLVLKII